ncbi:MAG: hypothetical protein CVV44_09415 [Spirochaetae bacterium HGW-Spirochaetae-1]|jgi:hypothetical protein|nr:MAG: hypothetical protein CVV44_09415 [Spirochaetae bacterium HGW-Spirochaetae-1]
MKKGLVIILSIFLVAGTVSCGGGKQTKGSKSSSSKQTLPANRGQATGYATIYDSDTALARDRATDDAKSKLVRQVLGETIEGRSIMKNFELVESIVEAKSIGLVKHDKIIKQWQAGSEYFVTLEGTVEPTAVADAIADILNTYGRPKFMVLIQETFEGKKQMPGFTETEMIIQEIMGNSGFEFVDAGMTQQLMKRDRQKMTRAMNGQVSDDVQDLLLNDVGAEVIIIGTAQTNDQSAALSAYGATNMKSKSAIVRLKAIDVYTGRIIATISRNAPGVHIDNDTASKKAIEKVFQLILGKTDPDTGKFSIGPFMETITNSFVKAASERQINLLVSGLEYNDLTKFRNDLAQRIRGVKNVNPKGQAGKAAKLELYFAGKTNDFADELVAKAGNMGYNIQVKESYPNKLVLVVKLNK